jgi:peptidoglycan hydrolase CwlO-like protein
MTESLTTVLITLITVAGSAGAWKFYEAKLKFKHEKKEESLRENTLFREDLRERVIKLEKKLTEKEKENQQLQLQITELKTQLAEYTVRLEFLEKENLRLRN